MDEVVSGREQPYTFTSYVECMYGYHSLTLSLKVCTNSGFHLKARIHIKTASTQNMNIEKKPNTYMYAYVEKSTCQFVDCVLRDDVT